MIALFHGATAWANTRFAPTNKKSRYKPRVSGRRDTRRGEFIPPNHNKGIKLAVSRRSRDRCRRFDTELPMA